MPNPNHPQSNLRPEIEMKSKEEKKQAKKEEMWKICCSNCYTTGMFSLPNPMSYVSSTAFAQTRLKAGSASASACLGLLTLLHAYWKLLTFNEGLETAPLPLARDPKYLPCLI